MEFRYLLICFYAHFTCFTIMIEGFRGGPTHLLTKSLGTSSSQDIMRLRGRAERRMQKKANKSKTVAPEQGVDTAREGDEEDEDGRGFGAPAGPQVVDTDAVVMEPAPLKPETNTSDDPDAELDSIFKKYGINEAKGAKATEAQKRAILAGKEPKPEGGAFGEAALSKIDDKLQQKIDDILIALTFGSLAFCVLCGLAISSTAIGVVFPTYKMDSNIDYVLKDILTPAFTPSLGIFFFFSITFGIFKFAQVSSQATVYSEADRK